MAQIFPTAPAPSFSLVVTPRWDTMIKRTRSGKEQRRSKISYAQYDVICPYKTLTKAEIEILWAFFQARKGAKEAFWFYDIISHAHVGLYVGAGDGTTEVFDICGITTSSQTIYVDAVAQTLTTDYVILTGGGDGGSDRVDFVSPPAAGEIITCDITGYLRCRVRFEEDKMDRELFTAVALTTGLKLHGLEPE